MRASYRLVGAASLLSLTAGVLSAQSVISAHSGVLNYYEGDVLIAGEAPHPRTGTFAEIKNDQTLQTQVGRAEVLLTPGVFLRAGENSQFRMLSNKLADTRIEFIQGSAVVDMVEVIPDNAVTVTYQDYQIKFLKKGAFRLDSEPAGIKVYAGEAVISHGGTSIHLKDGHMLAFTPALVSERFNNKTGDALYRWAKRRSEYISVANISAARNAGYSYSGSGTGAWLYNPYYSMYTYLPGRGTVCDPFGYCYWSPSTIYGYFNPPARWNGGGYGGGGGGLGSGYNSAGYYPTSAGTSSTMANYGGSNNVSSGSYSSAPAGSGVSSGGFSGSGASMGAASAGGGGGGVSHGGGSAGGHGK